MATLFWVFVLLAVFCAAVVFAVDRRVRNDYVTDFAERLLWVAFVAAAIGPVAGGAAIGVALAWAVS